MIRKFGEIEGNIVHLYEIENEHYAIGMLDYGATLVYWTSKQAKQNIVLGFDHFDSYIDNAANLGATVGRVCNRIGNGEYTLNNVTYHLDKNDKGNTLHGGSCGFAHRMYSGKIEDNSIIFTFDSPNGEGGFNGNIHFGAKYTLEETGLRFTSTVCSDEDTIFCPTNHAYFNLSGEETILNHMLQIDSEEFVAIDQNGLAQDETYSVEYTPFDFRNPKLVGENIREPYDQLIKGSGYDHHFIIEGEGMRHFATLSRNNLELNVYSTMPGFQLYSGNFLSEPFVPNGGICIETQYVPNAINGDSFDKPIIYKDKEQVYETFYELKVVPNND